ncbi:hypothetical protein [Listeria seeligeri]|uniref:hypothetical protein n=1 Tax=Listeria seeligeri TaxID=1640 RepID=UPI0031CC55CB
MATDYIYKTIYWDVVCTISKYFPNEPVGLKVTSKNKSFVFQPPKEISDNLYFYSNEIMDEGIGFEKSITVKYYVQSLDSLQAIYERATEKKCRKHTWMEKECADANYFITDEAHLPMNKNQNFYDRADVYMEYLFLPMDIRNRCEPIGDAIENLTLKIHQLPFHVYMEVAKILVNLHKFYEPFYIKKLTTI